MYNNNFDKSSTGINIEFYGCFDNDAAYRDFQENFERLTDGLYFCKDWGNVKTPQTVGEVFKIKNGVKKSDLLSVAGYEEDSKQDIIDEILNSDLKDYQDFEDVLTLKPCYEIKETRGYSQGDFATVILNKDYSYNAESLDHLFWDSPVYARFEINGKEFNYYDYDLDSYNWERDKFIELVAKDSEVDPKVLKSLCPEVLDYQY